MHEITPKHQAVRDHIATCPDCERSGLAHIPCSIALPLWRAWRAERGLPAEVYTDTHPCPSALAEEKK